MKDKELRDWYRDFHQWVVDRDEALHKALDELERERIAVHNLKLRLEAQEIKMDAIKEYFKTIAPELERIIKAFWDVEQGGRTHL